MSTALQKYDADIPEGHPSQETRNRFPDDTMLRDNGFTLFERWRGREPVWKYSGQLYTQHEALEMCETVKL